VAALAYLEKCKKVILQQCYWCMYFLPNIGIWVRLFNQSWHLANQQSWPNPVDYCIRWCKSVFTEHQSSHEGRKTSTSWTRPPGRPRRTWLNLVKEDANAIPLSSLWRTEIFRGHRAVRTTRRWWWIQDVDELRQQMVETRTELQQSIVAIEQWCDRLCSCVRAEEGHIQHLL